MKLLFVENHDVFARMVTQQFLGKFDVTIVPSARHVREFFDRGHNFDVALVDYDLDDGKGTEVVSLLRVRGFDGPIIAISARPVGNERLIEAGADAMCSKKDFAHIETVIRECAHQKS